MDTGRAHVLDRLAAEKRQALGCFEYERAAELQQQIDHLSAGSVVNPAVEQAARPSPDFAPDDASTAPGAASPEGHLTPGRPAAAEGRPRASRS